MGFLSRDVKGHVMRRNERTTIPRRFIVLDTETARDEKETDDIQRMRLAWTVFAELDTKGTPIYESWTFWKSRAKLMQYIHEHCLEDKETWIVGNNVYFDLQAADFFLHFTRWGWKLDFYYDNGLTYILTAKNGASIVKIVSTTNYYSASVRDLGVMLGLPKLDVDPLTGDESSVSIYCQRDTDICYLAMLAWIRFVMDNDLGKFSLTRAAQSLNAFKHRFMARKIIVHDEEDVRKLEASGYFGGRTEAFFIGRASDGPFVHLDVNSLYPFIMAHYSMPIALVDVIENPTLNDTINVLLEYEAVASVEISTNVPIYAYRWNEKTVFPVGVFRTTLCTESLRQAILRGHVRRVYKLAAYRHEKVFASYVEYFYTMRQEARACGDGVTQKGAKLMMNSLYGKFAQKRPIIVSRESDTSGGYWREEAYDLESKKNTITTCMLGVKITTEGEEYLPDASIAIPAHVTDFGRCLLWSIIEQAGVENVLYCDTDCVILPEREAYRISYPMSETRLGALKVEARYKWIHIMGAKDYQTDTVHKLKGIPSTAERIAERTWQYPVFYRQATHLEKRLRSGYWIETVTKTVAGEYDKGRVQENGRVLPLVISS